MMLRRWIEWWTGHLYVTLDEHQKIIRAMEVAQQTRVTGLLNANNAELAVRREIAAKHRDLTAEYRQLLDEEVRQRRRAIAAMAINQRWVETYRRLRGEAASEVAMVELTGRWGDCATLGQALDQIRISGDDDVAPKVLTDFGGLLPGWRPTVWGTLSPAARRTWEANHQDRDWLTYWRPPAAEMSPRRRPLDRGEKPTAFKMKEAE